MKEDELGCMRPAIDEGKCVHCNLCTKSCPNNLELTFAYPLKCYASWIEDKEKRRICASGGIGTIMSEYVINQGGIVFGSRYDAELTPIMTYTDKLEELEYFKGSRYVQSLVGETTYKKVKEFLRTDRQVLFVGTPCQIAGLKSYLHKDYKNLITVDLICHGVCPTSYLKEEIAYLADKYKLTDISDIRFRGNDGNNFLLTIWNKDGRKLFPKDNCCEKILRNGDLQQYYIKGFLLGVSMRENCYSCDYARPERISDITIGDFIGLGNTTPFEYSKANVSSVTINTHKGLTFYDKVSEAMNTLVNVERDYQERLQYKPSLVHPFEKHMHNKTFIEYYKKEGFVVSIRIVLHNQMRQMRIKNYFRLILLPFKIIRFLKNRYL